MLFVSSMINRIQIMRACSLLYFFDKTYFSLYSQFFFLFSNQMEQLRNFEEKHNKYIFNHLTVSPSGARSWDTFHPTCVTSDPYTEHIYVGEYGAGYLRMSILSESGDIVNQFIQIGFGFPLGIAIHQNNLYITLLETPFLVHFKVADDLHLIRSKEDIASDVDENKQLRKLAVSNSGDVFVTDSYRHRLQILDGELNYKRQISHYSMRRPCDVKLTADEVFVLCLNPLHARSCILVFNQMGFKLRSIIPRALSEPKFSRIIFPYPVFCLDSYGNFIINDIKTGEVKFFTKEGTLFQKLGKSGNAPRLFDYITGLTLTANHKLIVLSMYGYFNVQIFSCI